MHFQRLPRPLGGPSELNDPWTDTKVSGACVSATIQAIREKQRPWPLRTRLRCTYNQGLESLLNESNRHLNRGSSTLRRIELCRLGARLNTAHH